MISLLYRSKKEYTRGNPTKLLKYLIILVKVNKYVQLTHKKDKRIENRRLNFVQSDKKKWGINSDLTAKKNSAIITLTF